MKTENPGGCRGMSRQIFVFTAGNEAAQAHLSDSIQNPIALEVALQTLPSDHHEIIKNLDLGQGLYAWGAIPGPQNTQRWNAMKAGDWVLCVYGGRYRYIARLAA